MNDSTFSERRKAVISMFSERRNAVVRMIVSPGTPWERYQSLRALYREFPDVEDNPYPLNWFAIFTPIEREAWQDIRAFGMLLCPQYPVGRYFIDFADPQLKIGIECDGADWHDPDKDQARDRELLALGWQIFRVSGSDCKRIIEPDWEALSYQVSEDPDFDPRPEVIRWLESTTAGLLRCLQTAFYDAKPCRWTTYGDAISVLESRTYAGFVTPVFGERDPS